MEIIIHTDSSTPVYSQLVEQIKNAVINGKLKPGDGLPSVRQLANDLYINHNTVAKAYKHLIRDSIIISKGYRGTSIHPDALSNCQFDMNAIIVSSINKTIEQLRNEGATDSEIRIAFNHVMKNPVKSGE